MTAPLDGVDYLLLLARVWRRVAAGVALALAAAVGALATQPVRHAGSEILALDPVEAGDTLSAALTFGAVAPPADVWITAERRAGLVKISAGARRREPVERALNAARAWVAADMAARRAVWVAMDPLTRGRPPSVTRIATHPVTRVETARSLPLGLAALGGGVTALLVTLLELWLRAALRARSRAERLAHLAELTR